MSDAVEDEAVASEGALDTTLEAVRAPGFGALAGPAPGGGAALLFLETYTQALQLMGNVLAMTADRPAEQRFKPLVARARRVPRGEAHLALGVDASDARAAAVEQDLVEVESGSASYVVLISLAQSDGSRLAKAGLFRGGGEGQSASLSAGSLLTVSPSAWASEMPPPPKRREPAAAAAPAPKEERWRYCTSRGKGRSDAMPGFNWTGPLRPAPISPYRKVPKGIRRPDYAETGYPREEMESKKQQVVPILTPPELEGLKKACRLGRVVLDAVARAIRPGVTTDELDRIAHETTVDGGGYPSPLNYCDFPKSCCTSVNEVVCHGIPDARPLEDGDIVNIDISVYVGGYHGDLNETYLVGNVDDAGKRLIKETLACLEKAIAICKPGTRFRDIGDVISRHAQQCQLAVVRTYCGHGIGELFHCAPNVPHYARNKAVGVMKPGMAFTIEPMINEGVWQDRMWPDGWTSVTADGKRSAQFEHTMVVTDTGVEILTGRIADSPAMFPFKDGAAA
eukprot:CAMPEP_0183793070 /NCGR_PEP_ID=MMETSP0803_2-20130417/2982_1 /TAXON_ID=195967 /ORGANISM="Crustomastix stigmata, Strain CCMP3273" /LENGTH=509 /DNA_ID=CAMNT_0026037443 /DNA_START=48 /DNA_END=1577 /DNA_ORIENTATION=-